jgi:hypothetical protein
VGSTHPLPGVNGITEAYLRSAEKVSHRIKGETPRTPRQNRGPTAEMWKCRTRFAETIRAVPGLQASQVHPRAETFVPSAR